MAIEDFLKTWEVVSPPEPDGEGEGHHVRIEREGTGEDNVPVAIICPTPAHGRRTGTYSKANDRIDGHDAAGNPFSIVLRPRIVYQAHDNSGTGSWTAEDTSGPSDG